MILAGVDAGATTTRAAAVREDGRLIGHGRGGPGNPHNAGVASAASSIAAAVREATRGEIPDTVVAGVAGIEDPALKEGLREALAGAAGEGTVHLASDAAVALDGAFLGGPGIIVVAGTGSVTWARDASGREARAGGWGHIVDDAGSGYDIGRSALGAVLRAYDGRGGHTSLTPRVLQALSLSSPAEIVGAARGMRPPQIAALAALTLDAAQQGDEVAAGIVRRAGEELAGAAAAVWRALALRGPHPVAGIGGLFRHAALRTAFAAALRPRCPEAAVVPPRLPPVGGAVWRAFAMRGLAVPTQLVTELSTEET